MKKLLSMILASVMVLSLLAGCGGGNDQPPAQDNTQTQPSDSQTPSTPEPAPAPAEDVTIQVAALASGYEEAYPGMRSEERRVGKECAI